MIRMIRSLTQRPFGVNFITQFTTETHIDVCLEEQVPVVSFFWNDPPEALISRLHRGGAKAWMQVGSVQEAQQAVRCGIDAIIVQGSEAGGHNRSTASTFALIPAVVDAIAPTPVIAAQEPLNSEVYRLLISALVSKLPLRADKSAVGAINRPLRFTRKAVGAINRPLRFTHKAVGAINRPLCFTRKDGERQELSSLRRDQ